MNQSGTGQGRNTTAYFQALKSKKKGSSGAESRVGASLRSFVQNSERLDQTKQSGNFKATEDAASPMQMIGRKQDLDQSVDRSRSKSPGGDRHRVMNEDLQNCALPPQPKKPHNSSTRSKSQQAALRRHPNSTAKTGQRREMSKFSLRAGLSSFIQKSNIDIEELSANLSQRQNQAFSNSNKSDQGSRSDSRSKPPIKRNVPSEREIKQSQQLALKYRQAVEDRRAQKEVKELTPQSRPTKILPLPSQRPVQEEDNDPIQSEESTKQDLENRPYASPNSRQVVEKSAETMVSPDNQGIIISEDLGLGQSPNFFDPNNSNQRSRPIRMSYQENFPHDTSLQGKIIRLSDLGQGKRQISQRSRDGEQFSEGEPLDMTKAQAGQIVRVKQKKGGSSTRQSTHYSTFGGRAIQGELLKSKHKSYSPHRRFGSSLSTTGNIKYGEQAQPFYNDMNQSEQDQVPSTRQSQRRLSPPKIITSQEFSCERINSCTRSQVSVKSRASAFNNFALPQVALRPINYSNPFKIDRVWDIFQNKDLRKSFLQLAATQQPSQVYESIRLDLQTDVQAVEFEETFSQQTGLRRLQILSFTQFFCETQHLLRKLRQAVSILYQERLNYMMVELAQLQLKLEERLEMQRLSLKESARLSKQEFSFQQYLVAGVKQEAQVKRLKHDILRDICDRLRQKIVIYGMQLRIYEQEEVEIVFEELWRQVYQKVVLGYYFYLVKKHAAIKRRRREVQAYAIEIMTKQKVAKVFDAWRQSKYIRITYMQKIDSIFDQAKTNRLRALVKGWRICTHEAKLLGIDARLAAKYSKFKLCHKLFLKWRDQRNIIHSSIKVAKKQALRGRTDISGDLEVIEKQRASLTKDFATRLQNGYKILYDSKYQSLVQVRADVHKTLQRLRACQLAQRMTRDYQMRDFPLQRTGEKPSKENDIPVFKSLIKNQNPEAYKIQDNQLALEMKHEIHSLLVDTQNYFQMNSQPRDASFQASMGGYRPIGPNRSFFQQQTHFTPAAQNHFDQSYNPDLSQQSFEYQKAPNQLFQMLEKKLQRLKQLNPKQPNSEPDICFIHRLRKEKKAEVQALAVKIRILRAKDDWQKYYSLALQVVGREMESNPETYRLDCAEPFAQEDNEGEFDQFGENGEVIEYTDTQTAISRPGEPATMRNLEDPENYIQPEGQPEEYIDESFVQSSPGMDNDVQFTVGVQPNQHNFDLPRQSENQTYFVQPDGQIEHHPQQSLTDFKSRNEGEQYLQANEARRRGPSMSIISKYSRFSRFSQTRALPSKRDGDYTMEDYVQFAILQGQSRGIQSFLFAKLQAAKQAFKMFSEWRIRFYEQRIDNCLEILRQLELIEKCFGALKVLKSKLKDRADDYRRVAILRRHYQLFLKWSQSNCELAVKDRKAIVRFRQARIFNCWVEYLNRHGDYLIMILKAKKYHAQALTSKALLSMYTYTLKQTRAREFNRRLLFKRYFKQRWISQFVKSCALRKVAKRARKREIEWERTRFQREFQKMMGSFELWKQSTLEYREVVKQYKAFNHYTVNLLVKSFRHLKTITQISKASDIIRYGLLKRHVVFPAFDTLVANYERQLNLEKDWILHRQTYMQSQILIQWREYAVKARLARMFFKRRILTRLKKFVSIRQSTIPRQFWIRYRQILVFKVLRYNVYKNQKKEKVAQKQERPDKFRYYHLKLKKKAFIAILELVYRNRNQAMKKRSADTFHENLLVQKSFQVFKIDYLNSKKDRILEKVADDFRRDRVFTNRAYFRPAQVDDVYDLPLLQRVYTGWLQHTLDCFIKRKVLTRYQQYRNSKLMSKVVKAWSDYVLKKSIFNMHSQARQSCQESINQDLEGLSLDQKTGEERSLAENSSLYLVTPDQAKTHEHNPSLDPARSSQIGNTSRALLLRGEELISDSRQDSYELTSHSQTSKPENNLVETSISFVATDEKKDDLGSTMGLIRKSQETATKLIQESLKADKRVFEYDSRLEEQKFAPERDYQVIQQKSRQILEELEVIFGKNKSQDLLQEAKAATTTGHFALSGQPEAHNGVSMRSASFYRQDDQQLCEIKESQQEQYQAGDNDFIDTDREDQHVEQTPASLQRQIGRATNNDLPRQIEDQRFNLIAESICSTNPQPAAQQEFNWKELGQGSSQYASLDQKYLAALNYKSDQRS